MVRIFKVSGLEQRKQLLVTQSQLYRETLRLEAANVKYSLALWKRKFGFVKTAAGVLGMAAPVAGLVLALRGFRRSGGVEADAAVGGGGWFSKLMAGARLATKLRPLWKMFMAGRGAAQEARNGEETEEFR
jgi:hypothetical protein